MRQLLLLLICVSALFSQKLDLKYQSKNADFSAFTSTIPWQSGTSLPATCAVGQAFYKTDEAAGQNVYTCVSSNTWAVSGATLVSVKSYGAKGDGVTDDTAAINAALTANIPNSGPISISNFSGSRTIFFPEGTYLVNAPLVFYSGQILVGDGRSTSIKAGGSFSGAALFYGDAVTANYVQGVEIGNLSFEAGAGIAAIAVDETSDLFLNNKIHDIYLNCVEGIILAGYAQHNQISRIFSFGPVDRILYLQGNDNFIDTVDKEGTSGSSTDAWITVEAHSLANSAGNVLRNILLEGVGNANKPAMKLIGAGGTIIDGYWMEATLTNGYYLEIEDSDEVRLLGNQRQGTPTYGKLKLTNSAVFMDTMNTDSSDLPFQNWIEADADSFLKIKSLYSRRGSNLNLLGTSNVVVESHINRQIRTDEPAGWVASSEVSIVSAQNLFTNPNHSMGGYGWTLIGGSGLGTDEYITSEVGPGLMRHWVANASGSPYIYQNITVATAQVGQPLTLVALVKVDAATGFAAPFALNAGISALSAYQRVNTGAGWGYIIQTFVPQSAGTLQLGVRLLGAVDTDEMWIGPMSAVWGMRTAVNSASSATFDLANKSFATASAAPTTGTWKLGDTVYNTGFTAGGTWGWVCTTAGTPGTWTALPDPTRGVSGPASSTDSRLAAFDGVSGKLLKDSGKAYPSGTIVGTTDAQILAAKTFDLPILASYLVAGLPAAGSEGRLARVDDSLTIGDCTVGGGSLQTLCLDDGAGWVAFGDGGSGGGSGSLDVEVDGSAVGTEDTLNLTTGTGISLTGSNPTGKSQVAVAVDTAVIPTKAALQAGTVLLCAPASASGSTYTCGMSPALTAYTNNMVVQFEPDTNSSSGAITVNIDSLGAKPIKQADGTTDPGGSALVAGQQIPLTYDGTVFRMPAAGTGGGGSSGTIASSAIDFGSIADMACADETFAAGGVTANTSFSLSLPTTTPSGVVGHAFVSAADVVTVRLCNFSGSTVNPASGTYAVSNGGGNVSTDTTQTLTNKTLTTPIVSAYTVSGLPAAGTANRIAIVTDGTAVGDCTVGGGSAITFCRDTGSAWAALGDGTSGGGGGLDNVVEDTSPQLGGNLDLNSFTVGAATAADLTKLNALTATSTELNYVDGVTSDLQTQLNGKQATLTGGATTIASSDLTASRALVSDSSGKVAVASVTATELGYVAGVTSAIQTQLGAKQATVTGAATTVTGADLTANRAVIANSSGKLAVSAVTDTELGYLASVTSAIQTQLNAKQATITGAATTIDDTDLTVSRALVSDSSGKVAVATTTATELGYVNGVTSAIQTQLNGKLATTTPFVKGITILEATASEDATMFFTDDAITITQLNAIVLGSTPSVTWTVRFASDRSATGTEVVTSGTTTTSTTTGSEVTSFSDATIPAGSWVWLETTAASGTVDQFHLSLEYTRD